MLTFHVRNIQTGVYIAPGAEGEAATLSVLDGRRVTLQCAGNLASDPFPFDAAVFAPAYRDLYAACVAEGIRTQFGSAVQRPPASPRHVQRRATLVHGDPATHAAVTFYRLARLAAEEVDGIAAPAGLEQSPYECVFSAVRVFSSGEEDVLVEAVRAQDGGAALSAAPPPSESGSSLWHTRTSVPLRTAAQRRLFRRSLKGLCRSVQEADSGSASDTCVVQVRLAVFARGRQSGERVLCAEHLFSMVRSVCDVCASFGTSMEALCETLVCRRQGNLLDNPLLPVLLPGTSVDRLTIVTCISAGGAYASRACIDACCFGCSGERKRSLGALPVNTAPSFQRMTGALLLAVTRGKADCLSGAEEAGAAPRVDLDACVDRLLAHHRPNEPLKTAKDAAALVNDIDSEPAARGRETEHGALSSAAADACQAAEAAMQAAAQRAAEARRLDASTAAVAHETAERMRQLRHDCAAEEPLLAARVDAARRELAELEERRDAVHDAATQLQSNVEGLQQRERELERSLELQERYAQYVDATCRLYTEALEAKAVLMDSVHRGLRRRLSIVPLVERAAALQEKCDTYRSRVGALQREEAQLSRRLRDLESDAAECETALRRAEERLDTVEGECAQHLEQAAAMQATALEEYEQSVALLLRLKAQREAVDAEVTYLAARRTELADDVSREEAQLAALRQAACRLGSSTAAHGGGERCSEDGGARDQADAVRIVTEELRKVLAELGAATEELAEVEDVMIEESDRAVAALRRCDGEMMIRNERLLDRVTAYMDVQSRLALRSASVFSDGSSRRASRVLQGDKPL